MGTYPGDRRLNNVEDSHTQARNAQIEHLRIAKIPLRFSARPIIAQLIRHPGALKL
jgi:hypothetical protein